ncbi:MAG TPA: SCO family protein [Croceibacterium sp.]|nr:SCO family protein [Croceibacterium sp.]
MAGGAMNIARCSFVTLPLIAALAACQPGGGGGESGSAAGELAGARIGGDFTLVDQDGKPARWSDYAGKYRLVYFGYTYCPDVCPVDLQKIMAGYRAFEKAAPDKAAKIQPIFISVDPARDTPAVIKPYVAAFHPKLIGLTGTEAQIEKVKQDFAVVSAKEGDEKATKDYLVSHSRTPYLFGPDGKPIALVPVDDPGTPQDDGVPQAVEAFLAKWVK